MLWVVKVPLAGPLTIGQQVGHSSPLHQEGNFESIVFNAIRAIWPQPAARHRVGMKTSAKCLLATLYTTHFEAVCPNRGFGTGRAENGLFRRSLVEVCTVCG